MDLSQSAFAVAEEITIGMEYYVSHSKIVGSNTRLWYNYECIHTVTQKQATYRVWTRVRACNDPAVNCLKAALHKVARRADAYRIVRLGQE